MNNCLIESLRAQGGLSYCLGVGGGEAMEEFMLLIIGELNMQL